jgi:hypothetical protein
MLKNRNSAFLSLSVIIFILSFIALPSTAGAFEYTGTNGPVAPAAANVKTISANSLTSQIFSGQPPTTLDWFCAGGRTLIMDFDGDGNNDIIVASPYGEYNFSNSFAGSIFIHKGPVSPTSHGGTYSWDSGNWDAAVNTANTGYILGNGVKEHAGYAIAAGNFGGRALLIGRPYETGTLSQVAVLFSRNINALNSTATPIKGNVIDMAQMGNPAQTLGKVDMKNFGLIIKNIPGANAPAALGTYPNNFLPGNGMSLACGDVTGDSIDDIIIGCPGDNGTAGSVYIIKGKNTVWNDGNYTNDPTEIDVATMTAADGYKINGNAAGDFFGAALLVSNIYGDSRGELIIGATGAQAKGGVAIIPGGTIDSWNVLTYNIGLITETKVVLSPSGSNGLRMGHALAAGKFHDSGAANNDLIVTEFADADNATAAYVIFGNATLPAANPIPVDITIKANKTTERFGFDVSCGDINGDSFDDIAVTAPKGVITDTKNRGKVYVIHGMPYATGSELDLANAARPFMNSTFQTQGNLDRINTGDMGYFFGYGAAVGEVGGAGAARKELVVSGYSELPSTTGVFASGGYFGATYVFYTSTCPAKPSTNQLASPTSSGNQTVTWGNFSDPDAGDTMKYYHVQFSRDATFKDFAQIVDSGVIGVAGNTTQHTANLTIDGTYHYRVRVGDNHSFSQFSDVKQVVINKNPPSQVDDITPINGLDVVALGGQRQIKIRVTDDTMCETQVTAEVWIKSQDDANANDIWDAGEGSTTIATPITVVGAITDYSFNVTEGLAKDSIRIFITGWDSAKNVIPEPVGGSRANPKIIYQIHSNKGPIVSAWRINPRGGFKKYTNDNNAKYVNDPQPIITANLTDDDSAVTNIKLKVQGTEYGVGPQLNYVDPGLTFTPSTDLVNGSLPVELTSADDGYGNPLQPITTTTGFVIDRTGPSAVEANCQPVNGGASDKPKPTIVFALNEFASGVVGCGVKDSLEIKIFNNNKWTYFTLEGNDYRENNVPKFPAAITIDASGAGTGFYLVRIDLNLTGLTLSNGATQAVIKAFDNLDNAMSGTTYTINFTVGLKGPQAEKREPQPDNVKVNSAKIKIRIWSDDGLAIDTLSVDLKVSGPPPTNNVIYQKIGCNQTELVYDVPTQILTFDPTKTSPATTFEQGTITVLLNDVKDSEGNQLRSRPLTWTFVFDSIGPAAGTDTVPAKDSWTKNNKQIVKMKVSDVTTKVVGTSIKFKVDGNIYTTSSLGMNYDPTTAWITFDPTTQAVTFADKVINVELVEAFDEAGNPLTAGANNTWSFKVDSTPPVAANFDPPDKSIRNINTLPIKCRLTDTFSGIDTNSVTFKINGTQITTYTIAADGTLSYNATLPIGVNTCEVTVKDIATNTLAVTPAVWTFTIDNGRMQVINDATSPNPADNSYTNTAKNNFTLKMTKTSSGLDTASVTFDVLHGIPEATILGTVTAEEKSDHYLLKWTSNAGDFLEGPVKISMTKCQNLAGWNFLNAPFNWKFTYDKTKPFVTINAQSPSPAPNTIQTNNKVPITLKLDDALAGVDPASITLSIAPGGQPPPGADYTVSDPQMNYDAINKILTFATTNAYPDGTLTVTLKTTKDKATNTYDTVPASSIPYTWAFSIDTQLPVCLITRPPNDNDIVLMNDDYITATLGDPQGINTGEIKLTIVSSVDNTLENMLPVTPPYFTFTPDSSTSGTLKYNPKLKTPPLKFSDAVIDVYVYAKDNAGFAIVPNPIHRVYKVDTTGPVMIDGSKPPVADSRIPAPATTVGVSATKPLQIKCRLEDMPGGVKSDSITYRFTTTDSGGNVLTDTLTPLNVVNISPTVVEITYTIPNANLTAGAIPDVCTCEMEILTATDLTTALHPLQAKTTNKWSFFINNSNPIAINPYPANNAVITSSSEEVGLTVFHAFGINTTSIEFYYNNVQALFPSSPGSYIFNYDDPASKLSFKPLGTATSKWNEGTNTVELRHAKEKISGKDIANPVIWSFLCDTVPPLASMNYPNTQYVTTQSIDILINLTDATSGIDPATVTFEIKKQGETVFSPFYLTPGSALTYAGNVLKYSSGQPYQAGTHEIRLTRAKDRAGHNYATAPYPPGGPLPLTFTFNVVKDGPVASIIQPLPNAVVDYNLIPGSDEIIIKIEPPAGSPGVDPTSIELELTEGTNPARLVKVIAGSGLAYNATTKLLSYRYTNVVPPLPIPEGKVKAKLNKALDYLGKPYASSPNPLTWTFIFDTIAPQLVESTINPIPNKYALTGTQEITMRLDDGPFGSGFDTASIQIEVKYYPATNPANQQVTVVNVGTFLKFENKPLAGVTGDYLLSFIPSPEYAEGTVDVKLISCKDLAGHQYRSSLWPLSYTFRFTVDLNSPKLPDNLVQPGHIAAVRYTKNNMLPIIMRLEDGHGSQVDPSSIQLTVGPKTYKIGTDPNLTYVTDANSLTLTFTPAAPYGEGTVDVSLDVCKDFAGRSALGFPSNATTPYRFAFVCDTVKPSPQNPVPMNNSFTSDNTGFISLQLKDFTSGVNQYTITVRDKNSNVLPLMPAATTYNPSTYVLRTRTQTPMPEGTISVEVWCQDRATNEIESTETPARYRWSFLVSMGGPTVDMTRPSPATNPKFPRVNDNLQKLEFVFNDNGVALEEASIALTIRYPDATVLTFRLSQPNYLTYDALNKKVTFNPGSNNPAANPPVMYKEGTVSVNIAANNLSGFPVAGNVNWQFQVDSKGPYVVPGTPMPVPNSTTGNPQALLKLKIKDDLGVIDPAEILFRIDNTGITGGFIDNITLSTLGPGGLTPLTFNPADGEIVFDPAKMNINFAGEVTATLKRAKDDLGNGLSGGSFTWKFTINATSPWADNPTINKVIGGINGPTIPAGGAKINSTRFITSMEIYPQQASATINKNTIKIKVGGTEYSYLEPAMMFTPVAGQNYGILTFDTGKLAPAPSVPSNDSLEIALTAVQNSLGTNLAAPYKFTIIIDTAAPTIGVENPADKSTITNARSILSIELLDPPAHRIDTSSIEFTVNGILFNSTTGGLSYNPVTHKAELNPVTVKVPANYSYKQGNNNVSLTNARDEAGNPIAGPKSWSFFVDDTGPVAFLNTATPAPNTVTGDPRAVIGIKVTSAGTKINPATFLVNIVNHTTNLGDIAGTDEVRGISYNETSGFYTINPALHPLLNFTNGTISVTLKKVENLAGNQLQNPVNWQYYLDRIGPVALRNSKTIGLPDGLPASSMTSSRTQKAIFEIADDNNISLIDVASLKMQLVYGGSTIEVGAYSPGCEYSVSLGRFTYDPSKLQPPVQYPDGTVAVILSQAKDILGNNLRPHLLNSFFFIVNTRGPNASNPAPLPNEVVSSQYPKISFDLTAEPPASVVMTNERPIEVRVNGMLYSSKSVPTPVVKAGNRVTFDPSLIGLQFGSSQITFEIVSAFDSLGNSLRPSTDPRIGSANSWIFKNDVTPPSISAPYPAHQSVVGNPAPIISATIKDNLSAVNKNTIKLKINGGAEIDPSKISFDSSSGRMSCNLSQAGIPDRLAAGDNIIRITDVRDSLGNAIPVPYAWNVYLDSQPPEVTAGSERPVNGSKGNVLRPVISFSVADNPKIAYGIAYYGDVNRDSIKVRITNGNTNRIVKYGDIGFYYAKPAVTLDTALLGVNLVDGLCEVSVLGEASGAANAMADAFGNKMTADYSFSFTVVSSGPYVYGVPTPAPSSSVTNNKPLIKINLRSDKSTIRPATIKLMVDGVTYTTASPAMTYAGDEVRFNTADAGITLREGSIEVKLAEAEDELGNKLAADTSGINPWTFRVDTAGPTAKVGANLISDDLPTSMLITAQPSETLSGTPSLKATYGDGTVSYLNVTDTYGDQKYFSGVLELAAIPKSPVTFTFIGTDVNGVYSETPITNFRLSKTSIMSPVTFKNQKYYLVGLPVAPDNTSVSNVFTGLPSAGYTIWEGADSNRQIAYYILPGKAYWLLNSSGTDFNVSANGYEMSVPMQKFDINLRAGWNLVSFPYNSRVKLNQCTIKSEQGEVSMFASDNVFTERAMWSYDYDTSGSPTFSLNHYDAHVTPFTGYYIYAYAECSLRVPPVFVTNDEVNKYPLPPYGMTLTGSGLATERNLWCRLGVSCDGYRDEYNYFGLKDGAQDIIEKDCDLIEPPANPVGQGAYLSAYLGEGTAVKYCSDFRSTLAARKKWNFAVKTNLSGKTAVMTWQTLRDRLPYNYDLILYDRLSGGTVNMRTASSYQFSAASTGERLFSIIFNPINASGEGGGTSDTTRPSIISRLPYENQQNVPVSSSVYLRFDEKLNPSSVQNSITLSNLSSGGLVRGVAYYDESINEVTFKPENNLDSNTTYRVSVNNITDAAGNFMTKSEWMFSSAKVSAAEQSVKITVKKGWNLISVPVYPKAKSIGEIFSGMTSKFVLYNRKGNQLSVYNGVEAFTPFVIGPGNGYWLYSHSDSDVALNISGYAVPVDSSSDTHFEIPLSKGFNQIGVPFNIGDAETIAIAGFGFRLRSSASPVNVTAAIGNGYVRNTLYTFTKLGVSGQINPLSFTDVSAKLRNAEGFFVYSNRDDVVLRIPRPGVTSPAPEDRDASKKSAVKLNIDPLRSWKVKIGVASPKIGYQDPANYFGVDYVAEDGLDARDVLKLISPDPCLALYFIKDTPGGKLSLSSDIRPSAPVSAADGQNALRWRFTVASRGLDYADGKIVWDRTALPASGGLVLVDRLLNTETDMRSRDGYPVIIDGADREFEIIYTPEMR